MLDMGNQANYEEQWKKTIYKIDYFFFVFSMILTTVFVFAVHFRLIRQYPELNYTV